MNSLAGKSVVIVEDHSLIAAFLKMTCEAFEVEVRGETDRAEEAVSLVAQARPSHVVLDIRLTGEMDGVDAARLLNINFPEVRIIFVTGSTEQSMLERMKNVEHHKILEKPVNPEALFKALL